MSPNGTALVRYALEHAARAIGAEHPEAEYALQAALAERDPRAVGRAALGVWDEQARTASRRHDRQATQAFLHPARPWQAVYVGSSLLIDGAIEPSARVSLAGFALQALRTEPRLQAGRKALTRAESAARSGQVPEVLGALEHPTLREAPRELTAVLAGIGALLGAEGRGGEVLERMEVPHPRRTVPPPGFDRDRGRESRAEIVLAVLRAHDVQLKEVDRGRLRPMTRDDLAEAILRDPFWDDIDASVGEDGVVARILRGEPSPAIDLSRLGHPQVYIRRIVR